MAYAKYRGNNWHMQCLITRNYEFGRYMPGRATRIKAGKSIVPYDNKDLYSIRIGKDYGGSMLSHAARLFAVVSAR